MAIFGRRKANDTTSQAQEAGAADEALETQDAEDRELVEPREGVGRVDDADGARDEAWEAEDATDAVDESAASDQAARRQRAKLRPRDEVDLSNGPYDRDAMPDGEVLDFGAMAIGAASDCELRLDVDEQTQVITGMTVVLGENGAAAVQLQAFAAPKSSGIWYGIRREIAESLIASGGTAEEVDGPLGTELHVRMPHQGPDGRATFSPARFVGVDGPRWFLRAVLSGEAAVDETVAARAMEIVRSVGVRRGNDPRAPRELLELTIPTELMEQPDVAEHDAGIERLERGPEITETR